MKKNKTKNPLIKRVPRELKLWGFWAVCFGDPTAWVFADAFLIPAFIYVYRRLRLIVARERGDIRMA